MDRTSPPRRHPYKELNLSQLRSFCEVCHLGGYAAAAREMHLTNSAVWEQIKGLERRYNLELVERDGNRVHPTPHGERLLELVQPLLAGLESIKDFLHQRDGALPRRLTIVSNLRVLVGEISRTMSRFRRRYPSVLLFIRYAGIEEIQSPVLDGSADVVLTLEPGPDESLSPALVFEPTGELDYLLVTPSRHALVRGKTPLRLESIVEHPLILGSPVVYSRQRVQEVFHRHNLTGRMQIAAETSSDEYTLACVRAGIGVGIAVGNARSELYRGLGVRSLREWFGTARVGFMWRCGAHVPPLQREFADLLAATLNDD